jgi:hypothetical protein
VAAFNAASDLQQSTGAIDAVFGDWALDIEQAAQGAADAVGLSTSEYENLAAVIGSQLKGAGMNIGDVTSKTQDLITMGADMAATFGGSASDAVSALSSVLKGEFDPIERYGVSLKQSDINARLAAQGQSNLTGEALKQAQAQAALDLVTQQTSATQGMFASESDTAAGAQERLGAKFEDIKAVLGEKLLPIFTDVANWILDKAIPAFEDWTEKGGPLHDAWTRSARSSGPADPHRQGPVGVLPGPPDPDLRRRRHGSSPTPWCRRSRRSGTSSRPTSCRSCGNPRPGAGRR